MSTASLDPLRDEVESLLSRTSNLLVENVQKQSSNTFNRIAGAPSVRSSLGSEFLFQASRISNSQDFGEKFKKSTSFKDPLSTRFPASAFKADSISSKATDPVRFNSSASGVGPAPSERSYANLDGPLGTGSIADYTRPSDGALDANPYNNFSNIAGLVEAVDNLVSSSASERNFKRVSNISASSANSGGPLGVTSVRNQNSPSRLGPRGGSGGGGGATTSAAAAVAAINSTISGSTNLKGTAMAGVGG
eukprot:CAMPEP_0175046044 /NCGR_PEP_ID=MMETSP0052_2-20121109/4804_1 /TAXON_ID=51329 ORGANISM="Polytomella parva, Strain SAG 63-3" /NCGR_SAMPLE_ID=MMETSP0052_2 /ASSEMBLY_ACC=CAM_ASM_000194 /LENGTH=248 /DNA_ID=CAMNT_0016309731 /DNA_START=43 /DNA_END=786 /DNA_ORIENTATION=-